MQKYAKIDSPVISFNVGGIYFSTLNSTICKRIKSPTTNENYNPNLLEGLVSGIVDVQLDQNKALFIDRNPQYFSYILDYLRLVNTKSENDFQLPKDIEAAKQLLKEAEYYQLEGLVELIKQLPTQILNKKQKDDLTLLLDLPSLSKWKLIYKATRDGFTCNDFHEKCNGIKDTLTIVIKKNILIFVLSLEFTLMSILMYL